MPIVDATPEEWMLFSKGVSLILDLNLSVDLTARAIAHMLFIIVDGDGT